MGFITAAVATGREIRYPEGSGIVLDITAAPYFADATGVADVGPLIEQAVADAVAQGGSAGAEAAPVVYFPNGRYRIATPVVLETEQEGGQWRMLQGQSRDGVVLFSDARLAAFQDADNPVPLISYFEGPWTNNAFTTLFENFTVEIGEGNPGAIGIRFHGNNVARLDNVVIRSLDPAGVGAVGLDLKPSISAPGIIRHLEVEGFRVGIDIANPTTSAQGWTLDNVTVRGQTVVGIQSHRKAVQLLDIVSVNTVPAFVSQFVDGMVTMIGAELSTPGGQAVEGSAIIANGDFIYLRDVVHNGYTSLLNDAGQVIDGLGPDGSYRNGPVYSLWEDSLEDFAHLPVLDIPEVPWEEPEAWVLVDPDAQGDDTEALQAALLSGAKTVFLLPGLFEITQSVRVGPQVQRIASNWARIQWRGDLFESGAAVFYWHESVHDIVIMERIAANWWKNSHEYMLHNATDADLVLRDVFWVGGGIYRNEPTTGRLFVENCHNVPGGQEFRPDLASWVIVNQDTWMRQLNPEMALPMLTVDGGNFWVSGFKFGEQQGPVVIARQQAVVEMLGGYMNVTHGVELVPTDVPIIDIEDAQVSIRLIERAAESNGPPTWNFRHRNVAREVRNGETRLLSTRDPRIIHRDSISRNGPGWAGAMVPLYTSLLDPARYAGNQPPVITAAASAAATVDGGAQLAASVSDPDGPAANTAVHWRKLSGPGAAYFEDAGNSYTRVRVTRPGVYQFEATASDGLNRSTSAPLELTFAPNTAHYSLAGPSLQRLSDRAPRDGIGDAALPSIFLYAGDFRATGTAQEMEIRLHLEISIERYSGEPGAIEAAVLALTPKTVMNPPVLELVRTTQYDTGITSVADFAAAGTVIMTLPASSWQQNVPLELDVTDAIKAALAEGRDTLGLQLRMAGGPNDDGISNYLEVYGTNPATSAFDPFLKVTVASGMQGNLPDYLARFPDGSAYLAPLGQLQPGTNGWWFSASLAQHVFLDVPGTPDGFWMYLNGSGWVWAADGVPAFYFATAGAWRASAGPAAPGWYYDFSLPSWLALSPTGEVIIP
jgi:hypothetical protein